MLQIISQGRSMDEVIIVGAGIGGLTLGLALHEAGIPGRIFETAAEIKAVGVGINRMPPGNWPRSAWRVRWPRSRSRPPMQPSSTVSAN
jgi:cation diffusion facilitator CzcD-associated flavoprotein CzcO